MSRSSGKALGRLAVAVAVGWALLVGASAAGAVAGPIPGAGSWTLTPAMPGVRGPACSARIPGDEVDTVLLLNGDGKLVLIAGHADWTLWSEDVPLALAVDGGAPVRLTAHGLRNLVLVLVDDDALLARLRAAHTLDWTLPTTHVRGEVAGLGVAMDAVAACAKPAPATASAPDPP